VTTNPQAARPIRRSAWISLGIGSVLVALGIGLVIAGFPDETPAQQALLDAASIPFAGAVAVPIAQMTIETQAVRRGGPGVLALYGLAALSVLVGVVLYVIGFASGNRELIAVATPVTFGGLGLAFCFLAWQALKRERPVSRAAVFEEWLTEEEAEDVRD
jgi:hypothetical protein